MRLLMLFSLLVLGDAPEEGFVSLFNGKDISGWRFDNASAVGELPKNWSVSDGVIHLHGGGKPHIASQWPFDDFDMRFQWKAAKKGYNSGFYVRSGRNVGSNQINLSEKACGNLMSGAKGGVAVPELQKPAGEWNDWRVLAQGDKLTFWCNDKEAWSVDGFKPASGYLGFQAEGAAIDFKNLRIKERGYRLLDGVKAAGWSGDGDSIVAGKEAAPLEFTPKSANFVLRLEHRGGGKLEIGGKAIALDAEEIAKTSNPAGQWNYLQVTVAGGKAAVWHNGLDLKTPTEVAAGRIRIEPAPGMSLRGVRIRDGE